MLIVDIPKEYLTDENGILSCTKCRQYFPLLSKECSKHFYGCLIKDELARCGECKRAESDEEPKKDGEKYVWCKYWCVWKSEEGFCDVGKRKEEINE